MKNNNPAMPEEDKVEAVDKEGENSQLDHGKQFDASGTQWLCSSCEQLILSVDSFIITGDKDSDFPSSSTPNSVKGTADGDLQVNSGNTKRAHFTLGQLRKRPGDCRLCSLIRQAISRYNQDDVKPETTLFLALEVNQRQTIESDNPANCTRRIHLWWQSKSGKLEDFYLVSVAPSTSSQENANPYSGRMLANPRETLDLMKGWIDVCSGKHGANCQIKNGNREDFQKLVESTYFGVVDVTDMQLKSLPMAGNDPERYVALSYVWGQRPLDDSSCTTRSNVMIRIQRRGLDKAWDQLPKTIQDVLLLVKSMGERYVWIDSLCIVQDSNTSWELNARAMHLVYGNAHFTICAADGDSTTGLVALNTTRATTEASSLEPGYAPLSAECLPGVRLIVSRPPESIVQDSIWDHRGWTFQERLLSPRCLIFAEGQVFFQCRSTTMSQAIFTAENANGWSLDWTNSSLRTLDELRQRAFWFYMKCIELYTGRDLTNQQDILMAFQGTSWLLKQYLNAPLFCGLPTSHFDLALLWMPLQSLSRRKPQTRRSPSSHGTCSQDKHGYCNCNHGREDWGGKEFPSWSWCGWMGGKTAFQHDMLDGCLLNVQEWLRQHTWILWYARDYEGNLRPLWDRTVLDEDLSEETCWRGYAGQNSFPLDQPTRLPPINPESATRIDFSQPIPGSELMAQEDPKLENTTVDKWSRQSNATYLSQIPAGYYDWGTRTNNREIDAGEPGLASKKSKKKNKKRNAKHSAQGEQAQSVEQMPTMKNEATGDKEQDPWTGWGTVKNEEATEVEEQETWGWGKGGNKDIASEAKDDFWAGWGKVKSEDATREENDDFWGWGKGESKEASGEKKENPWARWRTAKNKEVTKEGKDDVWGFWKVKSAPKRQQQTVDSFGRPIRSDNQPGTEFTSILPDNPFGVARGPFLAEEKDWDKALPILQFWTWRTELSVSIRQVENTPNSTSAPNNSNGAKDIEPDALCQCDVLDKAGVWCGSLLVSRQWITERESVPFMFIALSDAKSFTRDECPVWNYYIPKEQNESEWDLYYVLLLQRNHARAVWERVALGKVFQAAFSYAVWDEIKLG